MALSHGEVLRERYRIESQLGKGGMGAVYRAWDESLGIAVAIKENLDASPQAQKQFESEARILARLTHPNLPRVTDHFFIPGQGQYLVMDFVDGEDLGSMLRWLGALPEPQVLTWTSQICDALAYLHSQPSPVIHRDIKPANIKIRSDGRAMLVDFGIAKVYDPALSTTMGAKAVTPGYSPPEQYGEFHTDARSDIYALGATLYHLLTGKVPPDSLQRAAGWTELPAPRTMNPGISPLVEGVILKAVEVATERRFQNVEELREALTQPVPRAQDRLATTVAMPPSPGGPPQAQRAPVSTAAQPPDTPVSSGRSPRVAGTRPRPWLYVAIAATVVGVATCAALGVVAGPRLVELLRGTVPATEVLPVTAEPTTAAPLATVAASEPEIAPTEATSPAAPTTTREVDRATVAPSSIVIVEPTITTMATCAGQDFVGLQCRISVSAFAPTTEAIYVTWQAPEALMRATSFTRRWCKDGLLILDSTHTAGEAARWTPSDGMSYYVYLSATEGTGQRLWNAPWLPGGTYRFELFTDGVLAATADFTVN